MKEKWYYSNKGGYETEWSMEYQEPEFLMYRESMLRRIIKYIKKYLHIKLF